MARLQPQGDAAIGADRIALAERVVRRIYAADPGRDARDGPAGHARCLRDILSHLDHLAAAVAARDPALFTNHVGWAKVVLRQRGSAQDELAASLRLLGEELADALPEPPRTLATAYVRAGRDQLDAMPADLLPGIGALPYADLARAFLGALLEGDRHRAARLVLDAVEGGVEVREIYLHVFQTTQHEIGRLWQTNRLSVAQEHYCTAATQQVMALLYPRIFATRKNGRVFVGTCVSGELHEIGLRMVTDFLELEGWDTFYLGANMPIASVVQTIGERRADLLGVSASLTTHVGEVAALIAAVRAADSPRRVVILAGGFPFNISSGLWRTVGADGSAPDAAAAAVVAARLVFRGEA